MNLNFERYPCVAANMGTPSLLVAGSGESPDFSQLRQTNVVRRGEWYAILIYPERESDPDEMLRSAADLVETGVD